MLKPKLRWQSVEVDESQIDILVDQLAVHPLVARLLVNRGIENPDEARSFLNVQLTELHDPFSLDGMTEAVQRIRQAISNQEKILIYGDYDADGVTSTGIMMKTLRSLQGNVDYYIPNRFTEGYGLNEEALRRAKESGVQLVITVDTGISAVQEAKLCKQIDLDLIITDHHEPPAILPEAWAVINPKKENCSYPFDQLAGAGVSFKLAHALLDRVPEEWLEIAALGTIADLVPLINENRVLAALGLKQMNQRKHIGLKALLEVSGVEGEVSAGHVGFSLGPRINASGRLDSAGQAVELLLTDDPDEAREIAENLDQMNRERQRLVETITEEASAMVESDPKRHQRFIIVAAPGWNVGVIGIVASRLVERYYRPTIVLGIDEETGMAKGSARSIVGLDIFQALSQCADLLPHFGGHEMAAGMSLPQENLPALHSRLNDVAASCLKDEDYIPLSKVDAQLNLEEISLDLIEELEQLSPYGMGNPTPRFRIVEAEVSKMQQIGRDQNHLKVNLQHDSYTLDAVGFRLGELAEEIAPSARLEVLGELTVNEWNNRRAPQLLIRDLHVPHRQIFDWRSNGDQTERFRPLAYRKDVLFLSRQPLEERLKSEDHNALFRLWQHHPDDLHHRELEKVQYVVLADLPPSEDSFITWLRSFPHLRRIYFAYGDREMESALSQTPDREQFKHLYAFLRSRKGISPKRDLHRLAQLTGLSPKWVRFMLQVFQELDFVRITKGQLEVVQQTGKRSLSESGLYTLQQNRDKIQELFIYSSHRDLCTYISSVLSAESSLGGSTEWTSKKKSG